LFIGRGAACPGRLRKNAMLFGMPGISPNMKDSHKGENSDLGWLAEP
jgi:hypothetical protein